MNGTLRCTEETRKDFKIAVLYTTVQNQDSQILILYINFLFLSRISHGFITNSYINVSVINSAGNYHSGRDFSASADRNREDEYESQVMVYDFGTQLNYACETGYAFHHDGGNAELLITCEENGVWNGQVTDCMIIECPALSALEHGRVTLKKTHSDIANYSQNASNISNDGNVYIYGSEIEVSCEVGYKLVGPSVRECLENGEWSLPEPHCEWVVCDLSTLGQYSDPPTPITENGEFNVSSNSYGDLAHFSCKPGYRLTLPMFNSSWSLMKLTWTCQLNGAWVLFNDINAGSEFMDAAVKWGQALCQPFQYKCPEPKVRFTDC
jgi:hypothetical protein